MSVLRCLKTPNGRGKGVEGGGRGRRRRDKGKTKGNGRRARNPRRDRVLHVQADQAEGPNRVCRLVIWGPFVCQSDQSLLKRRRNPFTFPDYSNLYWQVGGRRMREGYSKNPSTCRGFHCFCFTRSKTSSCPKTRLKACPFWRAWNIYILNLLSVTFTLLISRHLNRFLGASPVCQNNSAAQNKISLRWVKGCSGKHT